MDARDGFPAGLGPSLSGGRRRPRIFLYSHDTFGLGHIRRTRAIANAIAAGLPGASILIVSGSPYVGSFNFGAGIDFVRIPGVTKRETGDYVSANLRIDLDDLTELRAGLIRQAAMSFSPDVCIVDKEPTGFRGELLPTLEHLKGIGTRRVVGIRDVLDDPQSLRQEWQHKGALRALIDHYDDVIVYGLESFYRPLDTILLPAEMTSRIVYTGYLRRSVPSGPPAVRYPKLTKGPFVLVTTGGGGDGVGLIDWTISAYEADPDIRLPAVIVFGPFMPRSMRKAFLERIERLPKVEAILFDPKIEVLMNRAKAVVAMGGYNTFCEILSFDKPALIVPRARPRLEQTIRAQRASSLGLVRMLADPEETGAGPRDPLVMAAAISRLADQPRPSAARTPGILDGLARVTDHVLDAVADRAGVVHGSRRAGARGASKDA